MNFELKSVPLAHIQLFRSVFIDGITVYSPKKHSLPRIKQKNRGFARDEFKPVQILSTYWSDWNEPDMIKYKATNGKDYIIQDDNLLKDVCKFMYKNGLRGLHPYIHIKGERDWECYPAPLKEHLLEFIRAYRCNYDIYTSQGHLVMEANSEKKKI